MSELYAQLFGDAETRAIMGEKAHIAAMLRVEAALAEAEAALGVIPEEAGAAIARAAGVLQTDPASLAGGTAGAGIAAQPLIAALKAKAGEAAPFVHFGATSQDITDSAFALQFAALCDLLGGRLRALA
ncbi:MAG: lyase family protein, partial [Paracoccus sp. (in: a-proteobacteria)]|nr:lyase family protein [Paracoccus sp. (in: a-proteobacteria)]